MVNPRVLRRVLMAAFASGLALHLPLLCMETERAPTEYEVKAAYLYNFVRFVEWPAAAREEPFVVAVLGDDPFGPALDEAFSGDHSATIRRIHDPDEASKAQILFIGASEAASLPSIVRALSGHSVLTVGDAPEMARKGTIIAFRMEGNRVRFDINLRRAESARLKLSSQLLKVATIVGDER